jgi:ribosome-associated translation inhibitor RaiA
MVESITYRDVQPTPAIKRELLAARAEISQRFRTVVSVDWTLEKGAGESVARCLLHSRSGYYRAAARSRTMSQAISAVIEKLLTQRRREKAIRVRGRGKGASRRLLDESE